MKKVECIIMDWAGTSVDYGCMAPVAAFVESFKNKGIHTYKRPIPRNFIHIIGLYYLLDYKL